MLAIEIPLEMIKIDVQYTGILKVQAQRKVKKNLPNFDLLFTFFRVTMAYVPFTIWLNPVAPLQFTSGRKAIMYFSTWGNPLFYRAESRLFTPRPESRRLSIFLSPKH
jgi:hypothetical protein